MLTRLETVSVAVAELEPAVQGFAKVLGRGPSWRGEQPRQERRHAQFRLENTTLELRSGPDGASGSMALTFGAEDLDAARGWLEERGLAPGAVEPQLDRDVESGEIRRGRRFVLPAERTRGLTLAVAELPGTEARFRAGSDPAAVVGLDHVVVRTGDPEAAIVLYGDGLGLRLALDRTFEQWGARLVFFRVGGLTVELAAPAQPEATPAPSDEAWGLSFRVPDADAAVARLTAAGVDVSEVRTGRRPGTRVATVRDHTCGIPTLLLQPPAG